MGFWVALALGNMDPNREAMSMLLVKLQHSVCKHLCELVYVLVQVQSISLLKDSM